jgi:hypothetical protein
VWLASIRFLRLLLALLFIVTASADALAAVSDLCLTAHARTSGGHAHAGPAAHEHATDEASTVLAGAADAAEPSSSTNPDDMNQGIASLCHSNAAGCPGCIAPADLALIAPASDSIVFPHLSVSGDSADLHGNLRPPKLS